MWRTSNGRRRAALWMALTLAALFAAPAATAQEDALFRDADGQPSSVAHRGASGDAPENTLAAFSLAQEQGADFIEADVQRTRDGKLVVFHDADLRRTTNVGQIFSSRRRSPVGSFTLAELRRLDAGSWNDARFAGERIPSFADLLKAMRPPTGLMVEIKNPSRYPGIEEQVARKLRQSDSDFVRWARDNGKLVVASIDAAAVARYHRVDPDTPVGVLKTGSEASDGSLASMATYATFVGTGDGEFSQATVERIRRHGLQVLSATSTASEMKSMVARGIDGAMTDYPLRFNDVVAGRDDLFIEAESLLSTARASAPLAPRANCCMVGGKWSGDAELRLRGNDSGDQMTLQLPVPRSGTYELSAVLGKGSRYGTFQVFVDGEAVGDLYDGFRPSVARETVEFGAFEFTQGDHSLTIAMVGRNRRSDGYYASVDVFRLRRVADPERRAGPRSAAASVPAGRPVAQRFERWDAAG